MTNFPDEWANFEQRMEYKQGCLLYDFLDDEVIQTAVPSSPKTVPEPPPLTPTRLSYGTPVVTLSIPPLSVNAPDAILQHPPTHEPVKPNDPSNKFRGKDHKKLLLAVRLWASYPTLKHFYVIYSLTLS